MSATIALVITLGIGLVGCAAEPSPAPLPEPITSPTSEPSEPAPEPVAQPASCDAVLDQAGVDDLASSNFPPTDFIFQDWDYPILGEMVTSGVVCMWAIEAGDVSVVVGQLAMDESTWNSKRGALESEGFVQNDSVGVAGFMDGPDSIEDTYLTRGVVWRDGILYYASYPGILEFVPAFQS